MSSWTDVDVELPPPNEVVDVSLTFGRTGTTRLSGYRLSSRAGAETLWLNALTHEPFPDGWRVVGWRKARGETVEQGAAVAAEQPPKRD